jgi:hypothetical protein
MKCRQKEGSLMKTSSKIYFVSGVIATIGAMSLAYALLEDTDKSPKQLLNDGKRFIRKSIRNGDRLLDETIDNIEVEANAVVKEAKKLV